ncbi:BGTF surface domain-containing protein [Haloarcula litorea]|uniref:DUF7827 domain-containing protein n=1 Tax=Haloarcula litorea TaxID=3032579 RepID=UPI0023E8C3B4|nr:BGTF surface domain-containing protein [Halomicroarcula sp. GDY20]
MSQRPIALVALLVGAALVGAGPGLADATATVDDDGLPLASAQQQVVTGETSLAAGTELTVRLRSANSASPFLKQQTARVAEDGTFAAVFDMSRVAANTSYELTVHYDGTTLVERSGRVAACDGDCTDPVPETPTPTPERHEGTVFRVEQGENITFAVPTDDGGQATFSLGGPDVNYLLNVTVTDGNGDGAVPVRFDTSAAGTDEPTLSVVSPEDDSLTVTNPEPELPSTLDAADYEYRVYDGEGTDGEPRSVGTIVVEANDSAEESFAVDDEPAEFGFERAIYRTRAGETAAINVTLAGADAATVSIGGPETGYEINATVRDGNGDGVVTLLFDTAAAGREGRTLSTAATADTVVVEPGSEVARDTRIAADDYPLSLYRGESVSESKADIGTLAVQAGDADWTSTPAVESLTESGQPASAGGPSSSLGPGALALGVGGLLAAAGIAVVLRPLR